MISIASLFPFIKSQTNAAVCTIEVSPTQVNSKTEEFALVVSGPADLLIQLTFSNSDPLPETTQLRIDSDGTTIRYLTLDYIGYKGSLDSILVIDGTVAGVIEGCSEAQLKVGSGSGGSGTCSIVPNSANVGEEITVFPNGFTAPFDGKTIYLVGAFLTPVHNIGSLRQAYGVGYVSTVVEIPDTQNGAYQIILDYQQADQVVCGPIDISGESGTFGAGRNPCTNTGCTTAIGLIPTKLGPFAQKILKIATGLAGGIALILMVIGSIRVLTSAGNQQTLNAGREMIVAALAGLLFLLFSVLILQFIGITIIGIPGLTFQP